MQQILFETFGCCWYYCFAYNQTLIFGTLLKLSIEKVQPFMTCADGVFELASIAVVIALIDRVGRRFLQSVFLVLTGVTLIVSIIVNEYAGDNQCKYGDY